LVFNLDEVGISDWEDRKPTNVMVSITASLHNIHRRISRSVKHISIVTCISADGACLIPYVVISQDSEAIHRALEATGMQLGTNMILKHRDKPYANAVLFENYVRIVLLSHLLIGRLSHNLREEEAVLSMDNCSPHLTPIVLDLLSTARVRIVILAPHTMQIFQVLDLTLFEVFKRRAQYQLPFDDESGSTCFIKKVSHDFRSRITGANIYVCRVFPGIGIICGIVAWVQRVSFGEIALRESEDFRKRRDMDFPLENLSVRRRIAPFGWINRSEESELSAVSFSFSDPNPVYLGLERSAKVEIRTDSPCISVVLPCFYCYHFQSSWDSFDSILI
jgi:hypothetical protein